MEHDILQHFRQVREIIREGKAGAIQAVNAHLIQVNWQIGAYLSTRLTDRVYGEKVVTQLAGWLKEQEPTLKGYDRRSLYRMRQFFESWQSVDWALIPEPLKQYGMLQKHNPAEKKIVGSVTPQSAEMPPFLTRLSWTHHIEILKQTTSPEEMLFYLALSIKERYTVRDLRRQIKSGLFERQMLAKRDLLTPANHPQKDMLLEIFRDRYVFEFVDLKEPYSEYDLQKALLWRMKEFLLELGRDFLFIDEEMTLRVGMQDYAVDLVFFHRELQCLVAIDLKIEAFKPEHLGKMNFYLEVLDRDLRKPHENPSIGVILCKTKDDEVVEIAMSRQLSPALVAAYQTKFVDKNLLRRMLHQWAEDWEEAREADNADRIENTKE
ncbi:MAG: PDDEXK nuclease domain-containing protein [Saprospiraceae bacterium]